MIRENFPAKKVENSAISSLFFAKDLHFYSFEFLKSKCYFTKKFT